MGMNVSKGNMYAFVTHTFNTVKGVCPHDCSYCYMKRWGNLKKVRLDEREFGTDLGAGNFVFVGSSCDMFADAIPTGWIERTMAYLKTFDNRYLFQSKNPVRMLGWVDPDELDAVVCTTIETNRWYPDIMKNSPTPDLRADAMSMLPLERYVTIEPIMRFDLDELVDMIRHSGAVSVNIGADSGGNGLPEPSADEVLALIERLERFVVVRRKPNLQRLLV
jgi:DNA repair photolyase